MRWRLSPEQIKAYLEYWDKNVDGKMSLDHFLSYLKSLHKTSLLFREIALKFDTNKNGIIDADEFKLLLELMSVQDPTISNLTYEQFIEEADKNRNGTVSIQEFC